MRRRGAAFLQLGKKEHEPAWRLTGPGEEQPDEAGSTSLTGDGGFRGPGTRPRISGPGLVYEGRWRIGDELLSARGGPGPGGPSFRQWAGHNDRGEQGRDLGNNQEEKKAATGRNWHGRPGARARPVRHPCPELPYLHLFVSAGGTVESEGASAVAGRAREPPPGSPPRETATSRGHPRDRGRPRFLAGKMARPRHSAPAGLTRRISAPRLISVTGRR